MLQELKLRIESAIKSNEFLLEGLGANGNHDAAEAGNNGMKDNKPTNQNLDQHGNGNENTNQNVSGNERISVQVL